MSSKDCPCNGCVAPERHIDCHGSCGRYKTWNTKHVGELAAIREQKEKQNLTAKNGR